MKTFFTIFLGMLASAASCQSNNDFVIPAGTIVAEILTPERIYQHPGFMAGKVFYRNGTETEALLNYNNLSGAIEFIGPKGDTLEINKDQVVTIRKIMINGHTYFYQEGYLEQVAAHAEGKVAKRQVYMVANREKMGAFNQYSSLSAISSFSNLTDRTGGVSRSLKVNEHITMALRVEYFFGDKFDLFLPANKKNLLRSYPAYRNQIEDYLKRHKVDFKNRQDLIEMFTILEML